jgi:small subunit ribosomal protein S6
MRNYELTMIIPSDTNEEEVNSVLAQVQTWVESTQGKVTNVDHWGRRRLAYNLAEYREGYYMLLNLEIDPKTTTELERNLKLSERVMRHLLIRLDD